MGSEGPIIQIGSSFGSTIGQLLHLPVWQRITLIAGGAGAGIAATFNTPIGGVLFALEISMHEVSARTLVPVALATATGTYVGRLCFGPHPSFVIPAFETPYFHATKPLVLFAYVGLGLLAGCASALFIKSIYGMEDFFEKRVKGGYYLQHVLGMLLVGLIMYGLMVGFGHYFVEGVGYATVQDILSTSHFPLRLLVLLCGLKLLATALTLGSGASGGVFSPGLFLGAALGAIYGAILEHLFPALGVSAPAFAVAGMAGVIGGTTGAAMAAITMIFEMTLDYSVIIPMTVTVAISYGIRKALSGESIYTMKLARRAHFVPDALRASVQMAQRTENFMQGNFACVAASGRMDELVRMIRTMPSPEIFLVMDQGRTVGYLERETLLASPDDSSSSVAVRDRAKANYVTVDRQAIFLEVIARLRYSGADVAIVKVASDASGPDDVVGVVTKEQLGGEMIESPELLMD